jgi:sugar phosphate isomerase/epimerase
VSVSRTLLQIGIRTWAIDTMKTCARVARELDVSVVTGFMGSPIWRYLYSYPPVSEADIENGFQEIRAVSDLIFDVFDDNGIRFALEIHPTEIAFDYYSWCRLLETFQGRSTLGIKPDPSHLLWQGVDPTTLVTDFPERIFHVHAKDVAIRPDGRRGILGSHLQFGDLRRGWDFRSIGHGDVDFRELFRHLNAAGYDGPISVEWEDNGMERVAGATESLANLRSWALRPSDIAFDDGLRS